MMKIYKYLYYRLYTWNLRTWGESDFPQYNALVGVTFMMFLNLSLIGIILQFFGVNIFLRDETPKLEIISIMLSLFAFNYFQFVYKSKYIILAKLLKREDLRRRRWNTLFIWLYTIISFGIFVFGAILYRKIHGLS